MKIKYLLFTFWLLIAFNVFGQDTYLISYDKYSNEKKVDDKNKIKVLTNINETVIGTENSFNSQKNYPNEISYFNKKKPTLLTYITQFDSIHSITSNDSLIINKPVFKITKETKRILGLRCQKATTTINSNKIDIWFVNNIGVNAAPTSLGINLGLVLEMTRNNNFTIKASKIENLKNLEPSIYIKKEIDQESVDLLTYKDIIWKNKFIQIPLLVNQQINFSSEIQSNDSILRFSNGTVVVRKIKLPIIKEGSQLFIDVKEKSNGDAYDRTGSVFLIPTNNSINFLDALKNGVNQLPIYTNGDGKKYQGYFSTENFKSNIELMRFFTPFGINKFNHIPIKNINWQNEVDYRQEISEFQKLLSNQEVYIGYFIGNYDGGGHIISSNLTIHPPSKTTLPIQKSFSIFNTVNVMEMSGQEYSTLFSDSKGLQVEFTLNEDYDNAKLRFITTGHGGWENGDEFVPKENTIFVDNQKVFNIIPWRQDCGSYRTYNPASGNFDNGLSSSDYSRSNWCPGTLTNPYYIDLGNLKTGKHTIQIKIPQGRPEGNSFSYWNVSGVLIGE